MDAESMKVFALHRYFVQAETMRLEFDRQLGDAARARIEDDGGTKLETYMSLWYGCLYVVLEGWEKLKLQDDQIDELRGSTDGKPLVELLRRYRNGVFHFQSDYRDDRFIGFWKEGAESASWVRSLHREFGRWFLDWMRSQPV